MKLQLFSSGVILCALLMITSCCATPYSCAVQDAVDDGALSKEEAANLKKIFAKNADIELDSISDWSELIDDILTQNDQMNRHEIEKIIYDIKTKVIVYLDNTWSMRGYAQAADPRAFTSIFEAISTYYSANPNIKIEARYVSKSNVADVVDFNTMCNNLTGHSWAKDGHNSKYSYTDAFQMNDLFGAISRMVKESDVLKEEVICFFVSDMIPSTENSQIRSDRETMIQYSERIVTMMTDSLRQLSSPENLYSAALYQFFAPFGSAEKDKGRYRNEAIYYKYNNAHLLLHGEERPFYVLAIGNKYAVSEWDDKVKSGLHNFSFSDNHNAYIGGSTNRVQLVGYAQIEDNKVVITVDQNDKEAFIDIDPSTVPSYWLTDLAIIATLDGKSLVVENGGRIKLGKIDNADGRKLRIQVKDIVPNWIKEYSTEDDSKLEASDDMAMKQTFFLGKVFRAIVQGLSNSNGQKYVIDDSFEIEIKKQ